MKVLIAVPIYNRLRVAEVCLGNLYQHRDSAVVHIYNDHSTEFGNDALAPFADQVFQLPPRDRPVFKMESNTRGMGVQHLRWHQFRDFLRRPEFDYLYCTDSDAMHDPSFMDVLQSLVSVVKKTGRPMPICLYNSVFHDQPKNCVGGTDRLSLRKTAPGISHLYDRAMIARIVQGLGTLAADPDYGWDYVGPAFLGVPFVTTKTSYVEHFGAVPGSMHTTAGDWDRDRALNPTPYLAARRQQVIDFLEGRLSSCA